MRSIDKWRCSIFRIGPPSCSARQSKTYRRAGFPITDDGAHLRLSGTGTTSERRREIAQRFRVLLLIGDNLDDFVDGARSERSNRHELAKKYAKRFGDRWIIVPNAMYGYWEATLYDFDYTLAREEVLRKKLQALHSACQATAESP